MTNHPPLRILLPLDGSSMDRQSITYAAMLPASEIVVLHVRPDVGMVVADGMVVQTLPPDDEIRTAFEAALAPLRKPGCEVRVEIAEEGQDVAEAVIRASEGFDLVLMVTHGRNMAERLLFGSVSDRVTRHGTVPTLLLRGEAADESVPTPPPARIVVPLDGSTLAEAALDEATRLAGSLSLPVHLVRVVDLDGVRAVIQRRREASDPDVEIVFDDARAEAEREAAAYLGTQADALRGSGIEVTTEVLGGTVSFALIDASQPSDLLVMTSHGAGGLKRWLIGSVAEKLVREAHCPVLLVPSRHA